MEQLQALLPAASPSAVRHGPADAGPVLAAGHLDRETDAGGWRAALEALRLPALLLGPDGRVVAATSAATRLFAPGGPLVRSGGHLEARDRLSNQRLQAALGRALGPAARGGRVVLRGAEPLIAELAPLTAVDGAFLPAARAILSVPQLRPPPEDRAEVLRTALALSGAEVEVALALAEAHTPAAIAAARGVALSTVRQQIKSLHAKCGVTDRAGLMRIVLSLAGTVGTI